MPGLLPKHLQKKEPTTRSRSYRQESTIAAALGGRVTINSGATFGENDVVNDYCEVECKTTAKGSMSLKVATWKLLEQKCSASKIPIMAIEFERDKLSLAVLNLTDLEMLISLANKNTK